jgi:CBS domain-containing protein
MPEESKEAETPAPSAVPLKKLTAEKTGALHPQDTVETAGDRMREHDTGVWPVAEDRKLVGMVAEKNPDWQLGGHGHDPKTWQVAQIMNREIVFCYEDEDCATAEKLMNERGLQFLPVVDRQMRIVGIFSRQEIREKAKASTPEA